MHARLPLAADLFRGRASEREAARGRLLNGVYIGISL